VQSCVGRKHRVVSLCTIAGWDACCIAQALRTLGCVASDTLVAPPHTQWEGSCKPVRGASLIFPFCSALFQCLSSPALLYAFAVHTFLRRPLAAHDSCQATAWQLPSHLHVWGSFGCWEGGGCPPPCGTLSGLGEILHLFAWHCT
jgi:hypothetical protein